MQLADALQEFIGAGDGRQRGAVQLGHALTQQVQGLVQQLGLGEVDAEEVGLELLGELLERRGDLGDRQYAGHVRAALERVQRPLEIVIDRLRQLLVAGLDEAGEGFQVQLRLVAEDLQQLRVQRFAGLGDDGGLRLAHGLDCLLGTRGFRFWEDVPLGQGMGGGGQQVDVVALALGLGGVLLDQGRQQGDHVADHLVYRLVGFDAAIQHAVEQVLHRPAELADDQGADHAAAALEGMEGPAHFTQGFAVVAVGMPTRQVFGQGLLHFAGFFDEDFLQFVIHRLFIGRRRQQAGRHFAGRRVECRNRRGHDLGQGQRTLGSGRLRRRFDRRTRQVHFRQAEFGQGGLVPLQRSGQVFQVQGVQLGHRLGAGKRVQLVEIQARQGLGGLQRHLQAGNVAG
ncbi:hypothetical protein FQZ97_805680 [compost metagenome]